jgi:hypothetical protein
VCKHFDGVVRAIGGGLPVEAAVAVPAGSEAVGNYYWNIPAVGFADTNKVLVSESKWGLQSRANYEEIRNILAVPVPGAIANTLNGDDLSENLYRMYTGRPLRLGHVGNIPF